MKGVVWCLERIAVAEERRANSDERIAVALERLSYGWKCEADSRGPVAGRSQSRDQRVEKALRLLMEWGPDRVTEIAEAVGVSRSAPYKWPAFVKARNQMRVAKDWMPRETRAVRRDEM